jgi:hypothetical protein
MVSHERNINWLQWTKLRAPQPAMDWDNSLLSHRTDLSTTWCTLPIKTTFLTLTLYNPGHCNHKRQDDICQYTRTPSWTLSHTTVRCISPTPWMGIQISWWTQRLLKVSHDSVVKQETSLHTVTTKASNQAHIHTLHLPKYRTFLQYDNPSQSSIIRITPKIGMFNFQDSTLQGCDNVLLGEWLSAFPMDCSVFTLTHPATEHNIP